MSAAPEAAPVAEHVPSLPLDSLHVLDAREGLERLPDASVDCVVTSPPYWATRVYAIQPVPWADGSVCVLGLEPDFEAYLDHLAEVFEEVRRVLKPTGTLWVNLGDVYASGTRARINGVLRALVGQPAMGGGTRSFRALPDKTLCLIPERFALRMLSSGWTLRNKVIWHKMNFLPASVRDRFACSYEFLYLFSKADRYYFDLDPVRVPHTSPEAQRYRTMPEQTRWRGLLNAGQRGAPTRGQRFHREGKNPGDCWFVATRGEGHHHPAAYPEALCERPILAGCPPGGLVVDPFAGSGTTCVVAKRLGRRFIGFDASRAYVEQAAARLKSVRAGMPSIQEDRLPEEAGAAA